MIDDLESELTGALKDTSNNDNSAVIEEAHFDEAITAEAKTGNKMEIDLKYEQKTKSYEETTNIDI